MIYRGIHAYSTRFFIIKIWIWLIICAEYIITSTPVAMRYLCIQQMLLSLTSIRLYSRNLSLRNLVYKTYHKKEYRPLNNWNNCIDNLDPQEQLYNGYNLVDHHPEREKDDPTSGWSYIAYNIIGSKCLKGALTSSSCNQWNQCQNLCMQKMPQI